MKVSTCVGLTLTLILTVTSFHSVMSGTPLLQADNHRQQQAMAAGQHPLLRQARHAPRHVPCIFLSQLTGIKSRFEQWFDKNKDGRADPKEVKDFLKSLKATVSDDVVSSFIQRRDQNGNGVIDLVPEYIKEIVENDYGDEAASEWFYLHDVNDDGFVTEPELVRLGMAAGMDRSQAEDTATGYYLPLDADGDGRLNFEEFSQLYQDPSSMSA